MLTCVRTILILLCASLRIILTLALPIASVLFLQVFQAAESRAVSLAFHHAAESGSHRARTCIDGGASPGGCFCAHYYYCFVGRLLQPLIPKDCVSCNCRVSQTVRWAADTCCGHRCFSGPAALDSIRDAGWIHCTALQHVDTSGACVFGLPVCPRDVLALALLPCLALPSASHHAHP